MQCQHSPSCTAAHMLAALVGIFSTEVDGVPPTNMIDARGSYCVLLFSRFIPGWCYSASPLHEMFTPTFVFCVHTRATRKPYRCADAPGGGIVVVSDVPGRAPSAHYAVEAQPASSGGTWQPVFVMESTAKNASTQGYFDHLNGFTSSWASVVSEHALRHWPARRQAVASCSERMPRS